MKFAWLTLISLLMACQAHAGDEINYRNFYGVGVATGYMDRSDEFFYTLRDEGVDILMAARGTDWSDYTEANIAKLGPYGFKIWNMVTLFSGPDRVCADPELMRQNREYASKNGMFLADKPIVLNQTIMGETMQYASCYCPECNKSFRDYLNSKYGTIENLNREWNSKYSSWDQIEQLGTPEDLDRAMEAMKERMLSLELPTEATQRWKQLFELDRTRAIEWKRWHDGVLNVWYEDFIRSFKETNGGVTGLCEQPCWPDFRYHMLFDLGKIADIGGLDAYLPGKLPMMLGDPANLILNVDLNASVFHGKPLWCHELYVLPGSPEKLPEAQGWFLAGRGYSLMTYFTYIEMPEGEREGKVMSYGLRDVNGNPYPPHASFVKFSHDLKQFHKRYDGNSLRRQEPQVAVFMGDDVSLANNLETGSATWEATGVHGHTGAYWLTLRNGYPVEFVNDDFDRLEGKTVLIVPYTHVIGRESIEKLIAFARGGGTVIVDGALGVYDELYRPYPTSPGGKGFFDEIGFQYSGYERTPVEIQVTDSGLQPGATSDATVRAIGIPTDLKLASGTRVILKDSEGRPALVQRRIGQGQIYAYMGSVGLANSVWPGQASAEALWGALLRQCDVTPLVRLKPTAVNEEALCDVSARIKGNNEIFLFAVSFYGAWKGDIELDLPSGDYSAEDAITLKPIELREQPNSRALSISLPAFGTQVIRIQCNSGSPFADW